jgi:exosortase/archaeosortase family protein
MLQAVGVPAAREGTRLLLPHITLVVAEVCSGVNFLIAVVAIGIPLAYLTLRSWSRRLLLVTFGVLVSILSNSFRIALIGILNYAGVGGDIHGPFHVLQGMFVAVIGYIALFAGASMLSRTERHRGVVPPQPSAPDLSGTMQRGNGSIAAPAIAVCAALALAGGYVNLYRPAPVPFARDLAGFPRTIKE